MMRQRRHQRHQRERRKGTGMLQDVRNAGKMLMVGEVLVVYP